MDGVPEDLWGHEEEVRRTPYSVRLWWDYIAAAKAASAKVRNRVYERAVTALPGSYKLWHAYLTDRVGQASGLPCTHRRWLAVNAVFERALVFMHKMPVVWTMYVTFLASQRWITRTRHAFDRALQSLPVTQHDRIWPLYTEFVKRCGVWETCLRVYRRFLQYDPSGREEYVDYLTSLGRWDEAAAHLAILVNDDKYVSGRGTTKHALWMALCTIVSEHPADITSLRVEPVLRSGITRFTDEVGRFWCALAEYFIRLGQFEKARDVYEEGMGEVTTVRDFAILFDAFTQFEEALLTAKLEMGEVAAGDASASGSGNAGGVGGGLDVEAGVVTDPADLDDLRLLSDVGDDVDLRMARLEVLMDRRELLLSAVLLRQNPHNVAEWLKRAKLYAKSGSPRVRIVTTYNEAVQTVDPGKAIGKLHTLWAEFAKYYESNGDLDSARAVFRRGSGAGFKSLEDLAALWCEWVELEIRHSNYAGALALMEEATKEPSRSRRGGGVVEEGDVAGVAGPYNHRHRLYRNQRLWGLYLDLEESLGNLDTTKAAYERAITLQVVTPAMVLNFAAYLEERNYFEEAFRAYERGIAVFPWPHVKELWIAYLTKFVARYGGSKLERSRELFEQAVDGCPPAEAMSFFTMYADMEEAHGLVRHAMNILDRATSAVDEEHRYETFLLYIRKAEEHYGAPRTRPIYAKAVEELPEGQVKDMCMRFAAMETKLGELDRARAIYRHASQFADPRTATLFWKQWQDFETTHGNEETFRDMLRIKRSVAGQFSANALPAELIQAATTAMGGGAAGASGTGAAPSFVPSTQPSKLAAVTHDAGAAIAGVKRTARGAGLDAGGEGGGEEGEEAGEGSGIGRGAKLPRRDDGAGGGVGGTAAGGDEVMERPVPAAVFGSLAEGGSGSAPAPGALERLRMRAAPGTT